MSLSKFPSLLLLHTRRIFVPRVPFLQTGHVFSGARCLRTTPSGVLLQEQQQRPLVAKEAPLEEEKPPTLPLSKKARLKQAIKDYGSTVLVFHISMSLCSLGLCYLLISSGLDVVSLLEKVGVGQAVRESSVAAGASTFVIAYAVHKVFAPVRITVTLTATPLIVKKLRAMGVLKKVSS